MNRWQRKYVCNNFGNGDGQLLNEAEQDIKQLLNEVE